MRILYVSGHNDFAALSFERKFKDQTIKDIIDDHFSENISCVGVGKDVYDPDYFEMELFQFSDFEGRSNTI